MRSRLASALAVLAVVLAAAGASAATGPVDLARAVNVVPPGESGLITIPQFIEAQADGNFGPRTEAAVIAFQKAHGLAPDGVVGAATARKLNAALARRG